MKKTFVSLDQLKKITEKYPTPFTFMMKRGSGKMPADYTRLFPGIPDSKSILQSKPHLIQA